MSVGCLPATPHPSLPGRAKWRWDRDPRPLPSAGGPAFSPVRGRPLPEARRGAAPQRPARARRGAWKEVRAGFAPADGGRLAASLTPYPVPGANLSPQEAVAGRGPPGREAERARGPGEGGRGARGGAPAAHCSAQVGLAEADAQITGPARGKARAGPALPRREAVRSGRRRGAARDPRAGARAPWRGARTGAVTAAPGGQAGV